MSTSKNLYLVWKTECHRSSMTAWALGIPIVFIAPLAGSAKWRKFARYVLSVFMTLHVLAKRRPGTVFLLNQPLIFVLTVRFYCALTRSDFVLDCHSAPFDADKTSLYWKVTAWLLRSALFNINHNRRDSATVTSAGAQSVLIPEIPGDFSNMSFPALDVPEKSVLVVCSFAHDEPVDIILDAARLSPDVAFFMTGNWRKKASNFDRQVPPNVTLLGFVARHDYLRYLKDVSTVLTLSNRNHIMQMAAEECLAMGTPLITNRSPILEEVFGDSAAFVDLTPDSIRNAVHEVLADAQVYRGRMQARRHLRRQVLANTLADIAVRFPQTTG